MKHKATVFYFVTFSVIITTGSKNYFQGTILKTGYIQYSDAIEISQLHSVVACADRCYNNLKCMTFFHNSDLKSCVLHSINFQYRNPDQIEQGWKMYLFETADRCQAGFYYYRELDLCYNFNPIHNIDYTGNVATACSSYGAVLLRIDSQEIQTYMEHVLVGRPHSRVAIEGHSYNPGNSWTLTDGTPLPYTNWRPGAPQAGQWRLQMFRKGFWTEQNNYDCCRQHMFLCEQR